ncbi:MAG: class I SAM-dependent methyltransferase, partial [Bacteroidia bacterium]|nr:class I SAM-dependent methyltransferase [Bacteroidia bacterium]
MRKQQQQATAHSESHLNAAREYWWNEDYLALLADRLDLLQCETLADIGCGKGMMAFKFAPYLQPGAQVFGVDQEPKYIKAADRAAKKQGAYSAIKYDFTVGSAYHLPFDNEQMDVTLCQTLLIHL